MTTTETHTNSALLQEFAEKFSFEKTLKKLLTFYNNETFDEAVIAVFDDNTSFYTAFARGVRINSGRNYYPLEYSIDMAKTYIS